MSERDRLAELLERATRERRAGDREAPVTGGEWLPADPPPGARHRVERDAPRPLTLPVALRSGHLAVRPAAVAGVLLVVLVAGVILGVRWWRAEQASHPVPVVSQEVPRGAAAGDNVAAGGDVSGPGGDAAAAGDDAGVTGGATSSGAASSDAAAGDAAATSAPAPVADDLLVHVAGQVREPGVVTLATGARVQDAVRAAGGLTAEADTSRVNLARPVADGERIWVPRPGEEAPELIEGGSGGAGGPGATGEAGGAGGGAPSGGRVDLNTADQAALEQLPGVGPVTAAAILQWRTDHGRFTSPDELLEVSGIGEATLEKLLPHVTL